jgi:hypothetical protein
MSSIERQQSVVTRAIDVTSKIARAVTGRHDVDEGRREPTERGSPAPPTLDGPTWLEAERIRTRPALVTSWGRAIGTVLFRVAVILWLILKAIGP